MDSECLRQAKTFYIKEARSSIVAASICHEGRTKSKGPGKYVMIILQMIPCRQYASQVQVTPHAQVMTVMKPEDGNLPCVRYLSGLPFTMLQRTILSDFSK